MRVRAWERILELASKGAVSLLIAPEGRAVLGHRREHAAPESISKGHLVHHDGALWSHHGPAVEIGPGDKGIGGREGSGENKPVPNFTGKVPVDHGPDPGADTAPFQGVGKGKTANAHEQLPLAVFKPALGLSVALYGVFG